MTYLLYEIETDGQKRVRLSREDGKLDRLTGLFDTDCLTCIEELLLRQCPTITLEVYFLPPLPPTPIPYQNIP